MGRYHLVERLAVGGMAEVFLATERGEHALDRLVVIKRILPHLAEDESFVGMFLREARVAARITHPNVVEIYELGESGGYPFIAMEYVAGSTLKQLGRAARDAGSHLPVETVLHVLLQACAGAHAAHELVDPQGKPYGLVHRDLTPHNLMVTDDARVKLLDFGIAKASESEHTRTGMLKGKISYMSPEQCRQERLDRRSDIFALGIVAWELLAGRKPFSGKSELATMQAIVTGDLSHLREVRPDVPEPLAAAIHRALAVEPDGRYDTADDMRRELRNASRIAGIVPDEDRTALLIRTLLGTEHAARRKHVDGVLERTLVTLSAVAPSPPSSDPPTEESFQTRGRSVTSMGVLASVLLLLGSSVVGAFGAAVGIAWYLSERPGPAQDLREAAVTDLPTGVAGAPVLVALAPTLAPHVLLTEYEPLRDYLERTLERPVSLVVADNYEHAAEQVLEGSVPYAFLPHGAVNHAYERAEERRVTLAVLAVKVVDGSTNTDGYLVVPRSSPAQTIADLAGQVICYPDLISSTGYKLPREYIVAHGLDPDVDFVPHYSGDHEQVLKDLVAGVCAVGGTFGGNYTTGDERDIPIAQLRILAITGNTLHDAIVAGPAADPDVSATLEKALLDFDPERHAGMSRIGESERITGFAAPDPSFYGD